MTDCSRRAHVVEGHRCDYQWPQTAEEKAGNSSDCDHSCRLWVGHDGPHRCGDGAEAAA